MEYNPEQLAILQLSADKAQNWCSEGADLMFTKPSNIAMPRDAVSAQALESLISSELAVHTELTPPNQPLVPAYRLT